METITSISTEIGLFLPYILGLTAISSVILAISTKLTSAVIMSIGATSHFIGYIAMVYFTPSYEQLAMQSNYVQVHGMVSSLQFPGVALLAVGLFLYSLRQLARSRPRTS